MSMVLMVLSLIQPFGIILSLLSRNTSAGIRLSSDKDIHRT